MPKFITFTLACSLGIGLSPVFGELSPTEISPTDPPSTLTIYPSDDAFVSSDAPDNTSTRILYGFDGERYYQDNWDLWVGREWISALSLLRVNRSYLKFYLGSIPEGAKITSASLKLYRVGLALQTETTPAPMVQCYAANDGWDENSITWDNQPFVCEYLDSYENVVFWNSWDVTSFVQGEFEGDMVASFMLRAEDESNEETSCAIFPSKEYDGYDPHLEVTYVYEVSIQPIDDSYVGQRRSDTNYGDETYLQIRSGVWGLWDERRIFLKFDLSAIEGSEILEARLYLYCRWGMGHMDVQCRSVEDDSWGEDTITWNNQPEYGDVLDTIALTSAARNNWCSWDVTAFVADEFGGDNFASLCLMPVGDAWGRYWFKSNEHDDFASHPYLEVIYIVNGGMKT